MLTRKGWTLSVLLVILATLFLTPAANAQEPEEIKLVAWTIGPDQPSYYRKDNLLTAVERLNSMLAAAGSNIVVTLEASFETGEWGDYKQKFFLASEAGEAPDIICSGHEDIGPWSEAGFILPVDDYIAQVEDFYADVFPSLWGAMTYKGQRWGIPQDAEARPMYFSKLLLRKLGWSEDEISALPERIRNGDFTLYDMLETAKEAQDAGLVEKGYGYWHRPRKGYDFYEFYFDFGGELQDPETGNLVLVKDALLKHFQFHADTALKSETTPKDFLGTEWRLWHETVTAGDRVLFWNGGTWHWAEWQKVYGVEEDWEWENIGFGLIPAAEKGGTPSTLSHPLAYMISSQTEHPDLAFTIISLATVPDLNSRHAVESGHLAVLQSQVSHPLYKTDPFLQQAAYMLGYTHFIPNHPDFGTYDDIVFRALTAAEAGDVSPEEAVDLVVEELQMELGDKVIIK